MKWALAQLYKYGEKTFNFDGTFDFHKHIDTIADILDISEVSVTGSGQNVGEDRFLFNLHIKCNLVLMCARTLEAVNYPIDLKIKEIFDKVDDGECNVIEKQTIDLEPVIWENIYLEKPIAVYKEGSSPYVTDINELDKFLNDDK